MNQEIAEHSGSADKYYLTRFGSFILRRGRGLKSHEELYDALVLALGEDSRVTSIESESANHEWTVDETFYPRVPKDQDHLLLNGAFHFHSVRFSDALTFKINVPVKNQPLIHGEKAESSSYLVAWDGCTVVVMWETESKNSVPSMAGGQIVEDVLSSACKRAGQELYVQACSPSCKHLFAHTDFRVDLWMQDEFDTQFDANTPTDIRLSVRGQFADELLLVEIVHDEIKVPAAEFAELKNTARRILEIEESARSMSFELIAHDYETLDRSKDAFFSRLGYFFSNAWMTVRGKGRVKKANLLIASLWLSMANMETLQQAFRDTERQYQDSIFRWAVPELFTQDLKSEEAEVASLDPHFARAAIEHKTQRMDNRIVVWATIGGAGIGAVITAAVAVFSASSQ